MRNALVHDLEPINCMANPKECRFGIKANGTHKMDRNLAYRYFGLSDSLEAENAMLLRRIVGLQTLQTPTCEQADKICSLCQERAEENPNETNTDYNDWLKMQPKNLIAIDQTYPVT